MHASEDLGDVHDCSLRDGGGGDVDVAKSRLCSKAARAFDSGQKLK